MNENRSPVSPSFDISISSLLIRATFINGATFHLKAMKKTYLSRNMRFPTMWYVPPAKAQTSLRIRAV